MRDSTDTSQKNKLSKSYYQSNDPWPHIIIDAYYDADLFDSMKSELVLYFGKKGSLERQVYTTNNTTFESIFPETLKCLNSRDPLEWVDLFPTRREHNELSVYNEVSFIADSYEYPIHSENEKKVLSFVTYVTPKKSRGTLLYDNDKQFVKEVEWVPNRTLVFAGLTDITWHNYKVDAKMPRITINTFLTR